MTKQIAKNRAKARPSAKKTAVKKQPNRSEATGNALASKVKAGVDHLSTAVILIDRDFVVNYANESAKAMLVTYANELQTICPSFDPGKVIGSSVETFYKIPPNQRSLLVDPKNLPYRVDFSVGMLTFSLCVNPSLDQAGKYVGNMIEWSDVTELRKKEFQSSDFASQISAISRSNATIEFDVQGNILTANSNFLNAMGYTLEEVQGKHHSIFVDEAFKKSDEYRTFWANLQRGIFQAAEYKRYGKHGKEVWIQASYNPILDSSGKPIKVIKYATDVTAAKLQSAEYAGQIDAIGRTMAVIDFNMDGTIISANKHFLDATGYSMDEIKGRHHGMFVDQAFRVSDEYREFWAKLNRGEAERKQYRRIRKNGNELWLEASYNPIFDLNGKPYKIVKFATDITASKQHQEQLARAMAETKRMMQAIAAGNLSENMQGAFEGEFAELQASVNSCVDYLKRMMSETSRVMSAVASGDFRNSMEGDFAGSFGEVRDAVNGCVDYLKRMIAETDRVMKAVASGDLRDSMEGSFEGSFGELRDSVNSCVARLKETVEQIRNAMSTMTVSATEIASGNLDLSQRTEQQASSLATTAANMEQITATVKQNADSARAANSLATSAQQHAERGGSVVSNAISAMGAINEASKRIADIIGVIDDIAFQTNLLALNAAVEAARAGEQGRGFAVVASEVRNLAQRSAGAAKEIKGLIKDSVGRVEEGSRLVNESGTTLEQIVTAAKKVADIVAEIAAASAEQSLGVEKVTEAIQQMDVAVQQNAALVEETSAASSMMDEQTRGMSTMVEYFKLSDNDEAFGALQRPEPRGSKHIFGNAKTMPQRSPAGRLMPPVASGANKRVKDFAHDEF